MAGAGGGGGSGGGLPPWLVDFQEAQRDDAGRDAFGALPSERFGKNWSPEEERLLLDAYRLNGPSWTHIESLLPQRKGVVSKWKRLVSTGCQEAIDLQHFWRLQRERVQQTSAAASALAAAASHLEMSALGGAGGEGAYFMPQPMMMMGAGMGAGMMGAGGYYHHHHHPQGGQVVSMGGEGQSDYFATPHAAQDGRAHDVHSNMLQHNAGQMQRLQAAQLMQQHAQAQAVTGAYGGGGGAVDAEGGQGGGAHSHFRPLSTGGGGVRAAPSHPLRRDMGPSASFDSTSMILPPMSPPLAPLNHNHSSIAHHLDLPPLSLHRYSSPLPPIITSPSPSPPLPQALPLPPQEQEQEQEQEQAKQQNEGQQSLPHPVPQHPVPQRASPKPQLLSVEASVRAVSLAASNMFQHAQTAAASATFTGDGQHAQVMAQDGQMGDGAAPLSRTLSISLTVPVPLLPLSLFPNPSAARAWVNQYADAFTHQYSLEHARVSLSAHVRALEEYARDHAGSLSTSDLTAFFVGAVKLATSSTGGEEGRCGGGGGVDAAILQSFEEQLIKEGRAAIEQQEQQQQQQQEGGEGGAGAGKEGGEKAVAAGTAGGVDVRGDGASVHAAPTAPPQEVATAVTGGGAQLLSPQQAIAPVQLEFAQRNEQQLQQQQQYQLFPQLYQHQQVMRLPSSPLIAASLPPWTGPGAPLPPKLAGQLAAAAAAVLSGGSPLLGPVIGGGSPTLGPILGS